MSNMTLIQTRFASSCSGLRVSQSLTAPSVRFTSALLDIKKLQSAISLSDKQRSPNGRVHRSNVVSRVIAQWKTKSMFGLGTVGYSPILGTPRGVNVSGSMVLQLCRVRVLFCSRPFIPNLKIS